MTALLDTSVIIGMVERDDQTPNVRQILEAARSDDDVAVAEITLGELRHAVHAATTHRDQRTTTYRVAEALTLISIDGDVATIDAYAEARTQQPRCSQNDTWIIALARRTDRTLYTEDARMAKLARACGVTTELVTSNPL